MGATADEPVSLRVSHRDKPWVRDNPYGPGMVEVTGYRFVDADTGLGADGIDRRDWLAERGAVIFYAAGVGHLDEDPFAVV